MEINIYAPYKGNRIGKKKAPEITEQEVRNELNRLLKEHVSTKETEEASANGNIVNIDFEGFLEGVPFEGGKGEHYDLELGSHTFIPGFEENLIGHKKGEDVDVNVTFPGNYQAKNLAGKAVVFKCHINAVKEKIKSELNDEFAEEFGWKTLADLKTAIKKEMGEHRQNDLDNEYLNKLINLLISKSQIEVPSSKLNESKEKARTYYENSARRYGMDLNSFLAATGTEQAKFEANLLEEARNAVKVESIVNYIATKEKLEVAEEEINEQINALRDYYKLPDDKLNEIILTQHDAIKDSIKREKVSRFLLENND